MYTYVKGSQKNIFNNPISALYKPRSARNNRKVINFDERLSEL